MRYLLLLLLFPAVIVAQYGPNNPTLGSSVTGIGTLGWTNPTNILSSNNNDATQATRGTTNYLQGTGFGFSLLATDVVAGIRMDVERSSTGVSDVSLVGAWTVGVTRPALPAGTNRCLIVMIGLENSTTRDITGVSYGGRPMTIAAEIGLATPFYARTEAWYLLESDLALAANTTITFTYGGGLAVENFEIISSAVYANVDQFSPFTDTKTASTSNTSNASYQLPTALTVGAGGMAVTGIFCGNQPDNGPTTNGNYDGFSITPSGNGTNGYAEVVDYYGRNATFTASGGQLMVAHRAFAAATTTQPTYIFDGTPNRRTVVALGLRRARQMDNSVRIKKAAGFVGTDKAVAGTEWPVTDTYISYGGAADLWGTSWSLADINDAGFGGALSAIVQNGTATVDHMRITVFTTSVLPIELLSFDAAQQGSGINCQWITATERNTSVFVIERSTDGIHFDAIGSQDAAGNSENAIAYAFKDENPANGTNYYRLKTIDIDGSFTYSKIVSAEFEHTGTATVYPNPANAWATVLTEDGFEEIIITDAQGTIVDRIQGTSLETKQDLNLYDMPDGTYFVCVKSPNGKTTIEKLVKTSRGL